MPEGVAPELKSICTAKEFPEITPGLVVFLKMETVDPE